MRCAAVLLFGLACGGAAEQDAVTVTADGDVHDVHRPGSIVRKQEGMEHHHYEHPQHHTGKRHHYTKAMFKSLDGNEDGLVTATEIEASARKINSPTPKGLKGMLADIDTNGDGAISYAEFQTAAKDASRHNSEHQHEHVHHRMNINQHEPASDLQRADQDPIPTAESTHVTCGGHKAPTCKLCPTTDDKGESVFDHGHEWCHGDCVYHQGECHDEGTITVDGTVHVSQGHSTTPIPDLLNEAITPEDKEIIQKAAADAVVEEQKEKDLKEEEEKDAVEDEKFQWRKFWLVVIICISVVLGICAIVSIVAVVVLCFMNKPELPPSKEELLDEDVPGEADEVTGEDYD